MISLSSFELILLGLVAACSGILFGALIEEMQDCWRIRKRRLALIREGRQTEEELITAQQVAELERMFRR